MTRLVCRWRGHKLPRFVDCSHPAIEAIGAIYGSYGSVYGDYALCNPIACERCGEMVKPVDKGYPTVTVIPWP